MSQESFLELLDRRVAATNLAVGPAVRAKLDHYFRLLAHWNNRINLTSLPLEPPTAQAIERLIIEPVRAAPLIASNVAIWFDLGSGGGSPAIPLQLVHPAKRLILVESRDRKAAFLREVLRALPVDGAEVEVSRIELVTGRSHNAGLADLVTVRAVRLDASSLGQIQALLRFGGQAVLFGGHVTSEQLPRGLEISSVQRPPSEIVVVTRTGA